MNPPPVRDARAWLPVLTGTLFWAWAQAPVSLALCLVPGALLLGGGIAVLLRLDSERAYGVIAAGGLFGVGVSFPDFAFATWWHALGIGLLSAGSFVLAGRAALQRQPVCDAAPPPPVGWRCDAKAALDEALVACFEGMAQVPGGRHLAELPARIDDLIRAVERPAVAEALVAQPPPPSGVESRPQRWGVFDMTQATFDSGFVPPPELGAPPAWLDHPGNARARAWVLRHQRPGRPWLLGIHGYRMGLRWMDLRLFRPAELFARLGFNLVIPTLPLHGSRRAGRWSGDGYLDGDLIAPMFAQAQALWDLRRWLAWIRSQEPSPRIGVVGYSLGGYNAALLAAHDTGLEFVAAGIPVADFSALLWTHLPIAQRDYLASHGVDPARYRRSLAPVSPLSRPPQLPDTRLAIFAGTADRLVPPPQPAALARHWNIAVDWYAGGHLTFMGEPAVGEALRRVRRAAGWNDQAPATLAAKGSETNRS